MTKMSISKKLRAWRFDPSRTFIKGRLKEICKNVANCLLTKMYISKKLRAWRFDPSRTFIKGRTSIGELRICCSHMWKFSLKEQAALTAHGSFHQVKTRFVTVSLLHLWIGIIYYPSLWLLNWQASISLFEEHIDFILIWRAVNVSPSSKGIMDAAGSQM